MYATLVTAFIKNAPLQSFYSENSHVINSYWYVNVCFHTLDAALISERLLRMEGGYNSAALKTNSTLSCPCEPSNTKRYVFYSGSRKCWQHAASLTELGFHRHFSYWKKVMHSSAWGKKAAKGLACRCRAGRISTLRGISCSLLDSFGQCFCLKVKRCYANLLTCTRKGTYCVLCYFFILSSLFFKCQDQTIRFGATDDASW